MNWKKLLEMMSLQKGPQAVLVVEDDLSFLARLSDALELEGHRVTRWIGATAVLDGVATGTNEAGHVEELPVKNFAAFFLDHYFLSKTLNGESFLRLLRAEGVGPIMGMSSDAGANLRMERAGATFTMRKADFRRLLPY